MNLILFLFILDPIPLQGASEGKPADMRQKPLLITAELLWTGEKLARDQEVLIREGRIAAVGPAGSLDRPNSIRVLHASGGMVLPGLIDAHAHLFEKGGRMTPADLENPFQSSFPVNARQMLHAGVTSARVHLFDLEKGPELCKLAEADSYPAPRLEIGGPGFIGGAPELNRAQVWGVRDEEDAKQKVNRIRESGAQWIAIHNAGRFPRPDLEALVKEARRLGLRIMADGGSVADIQIMLELGVDSIEYLDNSESPAYPASLLSKLRTMERPPVFVAPIGYYHRVMGYIRHPETVRLGMLAELLPEGASQGLKSGLRDFLTSENEADYLVKPFPHYDRKFIQLHEAGVPMALGTDCGSPGNFHHDAIWWEIRTWKSLGVPMEKILRAATAAGADLLQREDLGRVRRGARGDLIVYDGNLFEQGHTPDPARIKTVLKGGIPYIHEGQWQHP